MKLYRFSANNTVQYGVLEEEKLYVICGDIFGAWEKTKQYCNIVDVKILAPVLPSKFVCVGLNYRDHAEELKMPLPSEPILFMKPSTAVLDPECEIVYPRNSKHVDYEAELGVIIRKRAHRIHPEKAHDYILGYTCVNDVTARDIQKMDGQWTRAKSYDTFAPIGPCIATGINPNNLHIKALLNDEVKQSSTTGNMILNVEGLVVFISNHMTLLPGDVIATGTPRGVGRMNPGDIVEVQIDNIGVLRNYVVEETGE